MIRYTTKDVKKFFDEWAKDENLSVFAIFEKGLNSYEVGQQSPGYDTVRTWVLRFRDGETPTSKDFFKKLGRKMSGGVPKITRLENIIKAWKNSKDYICPICCETIEDDYHGVWHHRDPDNQKKLFAISLGRALSVSEDKLVAELFKCDFVHDHCHKKWHAIDNKKKAAAKQKVINAAANLQTKVQSKVHPKAAQ